MIRLDYRDARPIYEQVRDGLRSLMVTGVLAAGEKLPSVRSLATELAINPNTIQRAYAQLEQEGYVYSVSGRGTFVAEGGEQNRRRCGELCERLRPMLEELRSLGFTLEELLRENRADRMRLLSAVDVLVDGPFRSHERSLDLLYRGSKNQRLIDMPATLKGGTIRLYAPPEW